MAASPKASKDHHVNFKTVRKWETELDCPLEYDISGNDVICLHCKTCKKWEKRIISVKRFSQTWVRPVTNSIKKDAVKSHIKSAMHKKAVNLQKRNQMGELPYFQTVVQNSQIGRGIRKICDKDRDSLRVKFNTAYYIAKHEKAFTDYPNLLELQEKNNVQGIGKNYITVFTDLN